MALAVVQPRDQTGLRKGLFLARGRLAPLAPAAFFCEVAPPCLELEPDPDFFPPRLEAPGLLAMRAARDFDMPFSFSFSYCFSFLTLADLDGNTPFPRCQLPRMELDMRHSKAGWSVTPPSVRDKKIRRHAGDIRRLLARNREYVMEEAPLPQVARPVMYHHWSPITFLHWRYPSVVMQFLLSPELTAERSGGAAWVRLTSFSWRVRVRRCPPFRGCRGSGDQRSHLRARRPPEPAWRGTPATVARRVFPDLDLIAGSVCGYSPRPAVDVGDEPFCSPLARSTG
jgi:hypothetical protein